MMILNSYLHHGSMYRIFTGSLYLEYVRFELGPGTNGGIDFLLVLLSGLNHDDLRVKQRHKLA